MDVLECSYLGDSNVQPGWVPLLSVWMLGVGVRCPARKECVSRLPLPWALWLERPDFCLSSSPGTEEVPEERVRCLLPPLAKCQPSVPVPPGPHSATETLGSILGSIKKVKTFEGAGGWGGKGVDCKWVQGIFSGGDGNIIKLCCHDGYTALEIYWKSQWTVHL